MSEEQSSEFGRLLDASRCRAKVWISRLYAGHPEFLNVLRQCGKPCVTDSDLCKAHVDRTLAYTKHGELMSRALYEKCLREREVRALMPKTSRRGKHWYTRHIMWQKAVHHAHISTEPEPESDHGVLMYAEPSDAHARPTAP